MKNKSRTAVWAATLAGLLMACGSLAGSLEAPAAPTDPASAMYTLNDIYNRLNSGAPVVKRPGAFVNPSGGPTNGTTRTLDEIMALATNPPPVNTAPAPVPKTGQTTSYAAGDDGAMQKGISTPNPRFTDNADGTVTDNQTGLMWTQDALPPGQTYGVTFTEALSLVNNLNAANSGAGTFGHNDWRLPNVKELFSLVDYNGAVPTLPPNHLFVNFQNSGQYPRQYWTSSSRGDTRIVVNFNFGGYSEAASHFYRSTWPVRGGAN